MKVITACLHGPEQSITLCTHGCCWVWYAVMSHLSERPCVPWCQDGLHMLIWQTAHILRNQACVKSACYNQQPETASEEDCIVLYISTKAMERGHGVWQGRHLHPSAV